MDTIIVGVDGSVHSESALRWAVREARSRDARVVAVLAWDYLNQPHRSDEPGFDPAFDDVAAEGFVGRIVDEVMADQDGSPVEVEPRAVLGLPARVLLDAAADADLLVIGRRGLGGFKGMLLGSVSQHVVQHAQCPVVVHQTPEH